MSLSVAVADSMGLSSAQRRNVEFGERWDGSGFPDGLAADQIPVESAIVSCCDAFNAMTTDRSYRAAMSLAEAMEAIA